MNTHTTTLTIDQALVALELDDAWAAPSFEIEHDTVPNEDEVAWWAVVVGGSFSLALAYAAYCTSKGGEPDIGFGWRGFKVTCHR